ncbi:hypothetical protein MBLNU459_g2610t1 [Dothideomycetes sp. NU459]
MARETRAALKGEKPKKAPKASTTARKTPARSTEVVVESDSDESSSGSSSGSNSDNEEDKRKSTKKPNVKKAKETEPTSPAVHDDSSDSDSDTDDNDAAQKKTNSKAKKNTLPADVKLNGAMHKTSEPGSSSESELDDAEFTQKKANGASRVTNAVDTSDSSDEEEEEQGEEKENESSTRASGAVANQTITAKSLAPQTFVPPAGYKPTTFSHQNTSTASSLLSNASSKQIWHITAPSNVPLSDIKSLSLASIAAHTPVLTHKGTSYSFTEDASSLADATYKRILIPSSTAGGGYSALDAPVAKTLHLQQVVNLPHLTSSQSNPAKGSNAAAVVTKPAVRGPRPQPKGLRMRYKPPGFGDADPGAIGSGSESDSSDIEMADASTAAAGGFQVPKGADAPKRKREELGTETTPRKDKKRRKGKEAGSSANAEASGEVLIASTPSKEDKKAAREAEEKLVEGTKHEVPETAEEKARKKEEKKKRKKDRAK